MNRLHLAFSAAFASLLPLVLSGCGGGGGGGGSSAGTGVLDYYTSFTGSAAGASQRVTLSRSSGTQIARQTLAATTDGTTPHLKFSGLPSETLKLHAELFSGPDATGTVTGVIDTTVDGSTASQVQTAVTAPVTAVNVTAATESMAVGASQQYTATAVTQSNVLVFQSAGATTWSVQGDGIATVSDTGMVTAVAPGAAKVQATIGGVTGSANLSVATNTPNRSKWTIMVFLNAANDLDVYAPLNVNQMESLVHGSDVRFVVQWKQVNGVGGLSPKLFSGTRRYLITPDSDMNTVRSTMVQDLGNSVDMGNPQAVTDFIDWTKQKYPADHYAFVFWNHGSGWRSRALTPTPVTRAISYDDERGTFISTWQLSQALGDNHLDVLAYDACNMQMLEIANEVSDKADYLFASEELTPGPGLPYQKVFKPFFDNPDGTPRDFAPGFVSAFTQNYASTWTSSLCMSVVDTSKLPAVVSALDSLGIALNANPSAVAPVIPGIRAASFKFDQGSSYAYYDLSEITSRLAASSVPDAVKSAATTLNAAVANCVVANGANSRVPQAQGLAIDFSSASRFPLSDYSKLKLASQTHWDEFLSSPLANPSN